MFTAIAAAGAALEVIMFGEHHIPVFVIIEINPLLQRLLLHLMAVVFHAS